MTNATIARSQVDVDWIPGLPPTLVRLSAGEDGMILTCESGGNFGTVYGNAEAVGKLAAMFQQVHEEVLRHNDKMRHQDEETERYIERRREEKVA